MPHKKSPPTNREVALAHLRKADNALADAQMSLSFSHHARPELLSLRTRCRNLIRAFEQ